MSNPIAERGPVETETFIREVADAYQPVVLRRQVSDWPAVAAGLSGPNAIADYICSFDEGRPAEVMVGKPEIAGRFFYSDDMRGFNFHREQVPLRTLLEELVKLDGVPNPPALYAGATTATDYLPGWLEANPLPLSTPGAVPRIWVGNATRVATHYDVSSNIACVVAGRRRFTLFPPEQIANLYVGPLETTIAGQPTSMVDIDAPDFDRFPRFRDAWDAALVADLRPGDAIFIPSLWWHNVVATGSVNVLVNYWWNADPEAPAFPALAHALLSIRDVSPGERRAWQAWFDHYVFSDTAAGVADHLPEHFRGVLGAASPERTQFMKAYLARALGRN
jgi:Cupin-like domain